MRTTMSHESTELVGVTVSGFTVDPSATGVAVWLAFPVRGVDPADTDWVAGSWEADRDKWKGVALLGPDGGLVLSEGMYDCWIRWDLPPERPVRKGRILEIV